MVQPMVRARRPNSLRPATNQTSRRSVTNSKERALNQFCRAIRAPKFGNHFALRRERAFSLRLLLRFVNMAERELRAGHQRGFAKLLI